ncbi:MAG: twin-arginine translocase subunit TatC [Bacteroidota bacterium]
MPLDQMDVDQPGEKALTSAEAEGEMTFLEHLEELRWHLVRAVVSILIFAIAVFVSGEFFFEKVIMAPKEKSFATYQFICGLSEKLCFYPPQFDLTTIQLGEQFFVHMKVAFFAGLIFAFPYIFWEIWRFIKPGLYPAERKAARGMVFICSTLFIMGILFGYYIIAPFAITFLANYDMGAVNTTTLSSYVNSMTMFTLPTGLVFELPIIVYFLSKVGLIGPQFMRTYRRHAFIVILILAAIITPPDVVTQFLIGIPLFILYEVSIVISARVVKNKEKTE